ncbi:MAG: DUF1192 domain-containing protein [Hyphomicrobiaceae bacterium]|nr:DUF1192 domain-containing protein [Hyphomicrobiaceae bacterium]
MDWDELAPKPKKAAVLGEDLTGLSVGELEERLASLEAEMVRVRREIDAKRAIGAAAAAVFKSGG